MTAGQTARASLAGAALLVAAWCILAGRAADRIDLLARFSEAVKRPDAGLFTVQDVNTGGTTLRSIVVAQSGGTRLTMRRVAIPDFAWLTVSVALGQSEGARAPVALMIGASDERSFEELWTGELAPGEGAPEWTSVRIDLSHYGGEEIDIIFNTRARRAAGPVEMAGGAVWGAPALVRR